MFIKVQSETEESKTDILMTGNHNQELLYHVLKVTEANILSGRQKCYIALDKVILKIIFVCFNPCPAESLYTLPLHTA